MVEPDGDMLTQIVFGATMQKEKLDALIAAHLSGEWTIERLEAVLRAVLRAGIFELTHRDDIPPKVTITEYVDIAHAFYAGPEPGLVNAVLDRIARQDRRGEMGTS
jgi:N utilization substance protein B